MHSFGMDFFFRHAKKVFRHANPLLGMQNLFSGMQFLFSDMRKIVTHNYSIHNTEHTESYSQTYVKYIYYINFIY
jgi:hypothetical protein